MSLSPRKMSKKSSARTGSEGDADSRIGEVFPNAGSRSSSYKSKKGIEAGPYGDSPSDQQTYKDCFFYMLQDNDLSDSSADEDSPELYSLRNDYLDKLNALRRRLNLIELNDDESPKSHRGCIITEIIKEEPESGKGSTQESDNLEIKTLHPFSVCYNFDAQSITDILELEYNPPKKKSCFRLRTPKLPSASDSNLPYHTKVSLREDLFQKRPPEAVPEAIPRECYDKFTRTQETQVEENDIGGAGDGNPSRNANLFPTVIVATEPPEGCKDAGASAASSVGTEGRGEPEAYPLNFVEDNSSCSYRTVTTSTTIIESPKANAGKPLGSRAKKSKSSMWEELSLRPLEDVILEQRRAGVTLDQYLTYRKDRRRAKSSPIKRQGCAVPFGPVLLNGHPSTPSKGPQEVDLDAAGYLFNFSSTEEEEEEEGRRLGEISRRFGSDSLSGEEGVGTFWSRLVGCFRPIFGFVAKR